MRAQARAALLAEWMTAWAGTRVRVDVAPTYRELALAIERGETDLAWAPPAVCTRTRASIRSALTVVRYGATSCAAVLVVSKNSGIQTLHDLERKRAVWVDPLSTSGFLLAMKHVRDAGFDPQRHFASQRFAGSYRDALFEVLAGNADVTSFYQVAGDKAATLRELHDIVGVGASSFSIVAVTAAAPFDALVVPKAAPESAELERRILALDQRMNPPAMLLEVCRADCFRRTPAAAYAGLERVIDGVVFDT